MAQCALYTGIALLHPSASDRLWFCADASAPVLSALNRMQQEDHAAHKLHAKHRTLQRDMRVRYATVATAPGPHGQRLTLARRLINHVWGTNDNAPNNKLFFGASNVQSFRLIEGGKPGSNSHSTTDANGLAFHEEFIHAQAAAHRQNGTPAEWAKDGSASMHACIHTLQRYLAADPTLTVDTIAITLAADGTPILPGYPGGGHDDDDDHGSAAPLANADTDAQIAVQSAPAVVAKKGRKRAASASSPAQSSPCAFPRVRSEETVAALSDSDDDHTDAVSVMGSGSVTATSPRARSSARLQATVHTIGEGDEANDDEWDEHSGHSEPAPTEAASSCVHRPSWSRGLLGSVAPEDETTRHTGDDGERGAKRRRTTSSSDDTKGVEQRTYSGTDFEPRWSPLSFHFEQAAAYEADDARLALTNIVDGISDDEVRSCMGDDEERSHPLEFGSAQLLETPQARPDEDAHEQRHWSAYQCALMERAHEQRDWSADHSGLMERPAAAHDDCLQYMSDA